MKKRITVISFLVSVLVLLLVVGLLTRGGVEKSTPYPDDSGVGEVEGIELSPDSLVF